MPNRLGEMESKDQCCTKRERSGSAERGSVIFQKSRRRSVRGSVCYIYIFLYFFAFILKTNIPNTKLTVEDMKTCIFLHKSR